MAIHKLIALGRLLGWVAGLSFIVTMGGCIACLNDQKTEYGSEELYISGGKIKSAPITTHSGGGGVFLLLPLIAAGVCAISLIGWTQTERKLEEARLKDLQVERELEEARQKDQWAKLEEEEAERLEKKRAKRLEKKRARGET
jgi:cell division protein FtsL